MEKVVFLPGLLCDAALWDSQVEALRDCCQPLVADLRGAEEIGALARKVLRTAPERFGLVGLSMGGYVAFEVWRQAPERVTRLALLATSASPDSPEKARQRRAAIASLQSGRFVGVRSRMLSQLIHPRHQQGPVGKLVQEMATRVGGQTFAEQQRVILSRPDSRPTLGQIGVPTLVGVGDQDLLTPEAESREISEGIAGSRFYRFAECGHLPPLECPEETTAQLRDWLTWDA
ncbi:alpha/beta hydrolase [bacterium SCN 62-11]|nr:MAG: alpha/beta hydrolase [bacterium SCN 62-11]